MTTVDTVRAKAQIEEPSVPEVPAPSTPVAPGLPTIAHERALGKWTKQDLSKLLQAPLMRGFLGGGLTQALVNATVSSERAKHPDASNAELMRLAGASLEKLGLTRRGEAFVRLVNRVLGSNTAPLLANITQSFEPSEPSTAIANTDLNREVIAATDVALAETDATQAAALLREIADSKLAPTGDPSRDRVLGDAFADMLARMRDTNMPPKTAFALYQSLLQTKAMGLEVPLERHMIRSPDEAKHLSYQPSEWREQAVMPVIFRMAQLSDAARGVAPDVASLRADLVAHAKRGASDRDLVDDLAHIAETYFAHNKTDVRYIGTRDQIVQSFDVIAAAARVDLSGRRRIDCEGYHYLTRTLLETPELRGRFRTRAVELPGHIATLISSRNGSHWVISNQVVTALGEGPIDMGKVAKAASGGASTFFHVAARGDSEYSAERIDDARTRRVMRPHGDDLLIEGVAAAASLSAGNDQGVTAEWLAATRRVAR